MKAQQQQQQKDAANGDQGNYDDTTPMKEIEPDEKSNDSTSRASTPTINNLTSNGDGRKCRENDEHTYMLRDEGEVSEV